MAKKLEQLYEGKAKKVFLTDDPDILIVDYKDDATAFNGEKKGTIAGKGVINNTVTNRIIKMLEEKGIPISELELNLLIESVVSEFNYGFAKAGETAVEQPEVPPDGEDDACAEQAEGYSEEGGGR